MGLEQLIVNINPDTPSTGSDLAVVNAARRSFGKRSTWEVMPSSSQMLLGHKPKLKDKDKRLIEFLARGMTTDDWEEFLQSFVEGCGYEEFIDKLWQWRLTPTHDTPFNHCFISFEVQAPIFVVRQLV